MSFDDYLGAAQDAADGADRRRSASKEFDARMAETARAQALPMVPAVRDALAVLSGIPIPSTPTRHGRLRVDLRTLWDERRVRPGDSGDPPPSSLWEVNYFSPSTRKVGKVFKRTKQTPGSWLISYSPGGGSVSVSSLDAQHVVVGGNDLTIEQAAEVGAQRWAARRNSDGVDLPGGSVQMAEFCDTAMRVTARLSVSTGFTRSWTLQETSGSAAE